MPYARPTPVEIRDRLSGEVERQFDGADPRQRRSVESGIVRATAIASHELHGHLDWNAKQLFVDTCDDDRLDRHGSLLRPPVTRTDPLAAAGLATFTGAAGSVIFAGTELRRSDDERYLTSADAAIGVGGNVAVAIAATKAGAAGNAAIGTRLTLIAPIGGVASVAIVANDGAGNGVIGGADIEGPDSYRARIIERMQEPADGGNEADWRGWVQDVVGKTKVWVYPAHMGLGTVGVSFIMPDGSIPTAPVLAAVAAWLDEVRPVTAAVTIFAPVVDLIDFTIALTPDTATLRTLVAAELGDMMIREAEPGGTLPHSRLAEAISAAAGEFSHVLTAPAGDVASAAGHIARLGNIAWGA